MNDELVAKVRARLDALNAADPVTIEINGASRPSELVFSDRLESWIRKLEPAPSDELLIAARGQHVRRWVIPRKEYPVGRAGYLSWREELKRLHARTVADAMRAEGCSEASVARAKTIVLKQRSQNPDAQTMEDALCLVFLETEFESLHSKVLDDKMVDILRKTWAKMSEKARAAAHRLNIPRAQLALIQRALDAK